jgi:hypothetical protein
MSKPAAIITHKSYLKYSQEAHQAEDAAEVAAQEFEAGTGVPIGWFGKHDRGLDAWGGRHLAIVGMPLLSKESIAGAYACTRAAMTDCGIPMPEWDQVMDKEKADADGPPMPVMPEVRAWLVDEYAQGLAQAVGRNRAVNHPCGRKPLQVHLWGGLQTTEMDAALRRYGVTVHDRARNPNSAPGPKVDIGAVDEAIRMVLATGGSVSVRSVRAALAGLRRSASTDAISARIREMRDIGAIPAATRVRQSKAETVCAAPTHIHVAAIESDASEADAAKVPGHNEPKNQGQENMVLPAAPAIETSHSDATTVPNSYKDTNSGDSEQCRTNPQKQGQENIFIAPDFASDAAQIPPDDEITEMLLDLAAEIEAELVLNDDPDDPDPHNPGGRRTVREHVAPASALRAAAGIGHIPYNNPSGAAPL